MDSHCWGAEGLCTSRGVTQRGYVLRVGIFLQDSNLIRKHKIRKSQSNLSGWMNLMRKSCQAGREIDTGVHAEALERHEDFDL